MEWKILALQKHLPWPKIKMYFSFGKRNKNKNNSLLWLSGMSIIVCLNVRIFILEIGPLFSGILKQFKLHFMAGRHGSISDMSLTEHLSFHFANS